MGEFEKQGLINEIQQKSGIDSLDGREKRVLLGGIIFVLCFFVFQLVISPLLDVRTNLEASIEKKSRELEKIKQLKGEYQRLKVQEGGIQAMIAVPTRRTRLSPLGTTRARISNTREKPITGPRIVSS